MGDRLTAATQVASRSRAAHDSSGCLSYRWSSVAATRRTGSFGRWDNRLLRARLCIQER
jgi:hypothetical protein